MNIRIFSCVAVLASIACGAAQANGERDLGTETLQPENGWAASGSGVTGGSAAVPTQIYTVTNRRELIAALNNGVPSSTSPSNPSNEPKIIYVSGTIDANVDDANNRSRATDYYRDGYTLEAFLAAYDPRCLRDASYRAVRSKRRASPRRRATGSRADSAGLEHDHRGPRQGRRRSAARGSTFAVRQTHRTAARNIIIRNITFQRYLRLLPAVGADRRCAR